MRNYYTNETIGEYILRRLQMPIMLTTLIILSLTYISMEMHSRKLEEFEKTHFTNISVKHEMSVKEQFMADIKKMPVPQEILQKETTVIEEENEVINTVETVTTITEETYAQEKIPQITTTKENSTLEEVPQVTTSKDDYAQSDVELLAKLMYAEEGIYIYKLSEAEAKYICQLAGSVVLHRKNMEYGGADTIKEVIYANGQYECVSNGSINQEVPDIVYEWAEELLKNGPIGPSNMVYQAQFEQGDYVYDQIGNQYFCVEKSYNN